MVFDMVGSFYLVKGDAPLSFVKDEKKFHVPISGKFSTPNLELFLSNRQGNSPVPAANPFFPLVFDGYFFYRRNFSPKIAITGGSFDFYTGRIALEVDSGENMAIGDFDFNTNSFNLKWANRPFGSLWPKQELEKFVLTNM
jgi:hypothetical protein